MIREFSIKNYKSLLDLKLELGRINLFIGENGCGKTNILEAMAMGAGAVTGKLDAEEMYNRGVRLAKPEITLSSFAGVRSGTGIQLNFALAEQEENRLARVAQHLVSRSTGVGSFEWAEISSEELSTQLAGTTLTDDEAQAFSNLIDLIAQWKETKEPQRLEGEARKLPAPVRGFFGYHLTRNVLKQELGSFLIYNANQLALRGLLNLSRKEPLGINGENLDVAIASLGDKGIKELLERSALVRWVERIFTEPEDKLKFEGYKLGRSTSTLYFRDRFMRKRANIFSAENANEGILHALFYLTLFISDRTPKTFGIDNIETALNPRLCRNLVKQLGELAKAHDKQALITTHNPAALDGLDLHDDEQRLFVVSRNDAGQTVANRIKLKPETKGKKPRLMLSEMWMRGQLGGIPLEF
jgi:energy-coupling factor transporter ATP-binding protein EcfA2